MHSGSAQGTLEVRYMKHTLGQDGGGSLCWSKLVKLLGPHSTLMPYKHLCPAEQTWVGKREKRCRDLSPAGN